MSGISKDLKPIDEQTQSVYEENAACYDENRAKGLFEKGYLDKFLSLLKGRKKVLDLGCGAGDPIARYLIENGCLVTGTDYADSMLSICKERFPDHEWIKADMREIKLEDSFNGIISWGAFFHLSQDQQRASLPKVCDLLQPEGILLMTVGHEEGEVTGTVAGQKVYHSSLSKIEYETILEDCGLEVLEFNLQDANCQFFSVFIAKKLA